MPAPRALALWPRTAIVAAFTVLAAVLFASAMVSFINYDEEQYIAGAVFARTLSPYGDFVSLQPPVFTWINAALFRLVDGWYVLAARVLVWLLSVASCALLYSLVRSLGPDRLASFVLVLAFVTSPFVRNALVLARNDIMPMFFLLSGLRLYFARDGNVATGAARSMAGGVLLSLAAATKYLYVFAAPIALVALIVADRERPGPGGALASARVRAFFAGAALGALPLVMALVVHGERFVFETLQFHEGAVAAWYAAQGQADMLSLPGELNAFLARTSRFGNATILLVAVAAIGVLGTRGAKPLAMRIGDRATLAMLGAAIVLGLYVGPHPMYYAPVTVLAILVAARLYAAARASVASRSLAAFLVACLVFAAPEFLRFGAHVRTSLDPSRWVGVQAHRSALAIAAALRQRGIDGHVATLFPSVVLDANRVRPEFAAGPFFFRSADRYPRERVVALRSVGPATLDALFAHDTPAAILAGFGPFDLFNGMDAALLDYARRAGYERMSDQWTVGGYTNGQLWIRRAAAAGVR